MVNDFFLELVNRSLIVSGMKSLSLHAGRRARQIVPTLAAQGAVTLASSGSVLTDDLKLFTTTFAGGLVFFGTFFS